MRSFAEECLHDALEKDKDEESEDKGKVCGC